MPACDGCKSDRIITFTGKCRCSDMFTAEYNNVEYMDYVPRDLGIGGGDYIKINLCLECGKVQGIKNHEDPVFYTDSQEE